MDERLHRMLKMNEVEYRIDQELSSYSSIKIGGRAVLIILPDTLDKLVSLLDYFRNEGKAFKIVGRMTNVLPPDGVFDTPLITTRRLFGFSVDERGIVSANAGESLVRILRHTAEKNLGGCEALAGIPGTLGGLAAMNAGAFGSEISEFFIEACVYHIKNGKNFTLSRDDMSFSYRKSLLRDGNIILLSLKLKLIEKDRNAVLSDIEKYREMRLLSQPTEPSLGSVFMRSDGVIPARLIDESGLRGKRIGGAEVSEKHAGFIVNRGGATASDFKSLALYIKREVYLRSGATLIREVEYL